MGIKISEMTPVASASGSELLPASVSDAPRRVSVEQLKDYTLAATAAISPASAVSAGNGVYILQGGAVKPVDIDKVTQRAIDIIWGKTAETAPDAADILALKDGGTTEKTVTLALLAEYVRSAIEAAILDVSNLDAISSFADANEMLVTQGTTGKKVTWANVKAAMFAALSTFVPGLAAATTTNDADILYVIQGGTAKQMALSKLVEHFTGSSPVTGSGTTNAFARWASSGVLKGDVTFSTVLQSGTDTNVASSKAVRDAMSKLVFDQSESQAAIADADYLMLDIGGVGTTQRKVAMPLVFDYINASNAAGEGIKTIVSDSVVTLGAIAGVDILTIPAGSHILSIQANVQVLAVAGGTSEKIGVGFAADPDAYGLTGSLVKNQKIDTFMENYDLLLDTAPEYTDRGNSIQWTREAVALKAYPCTTAGAIGDTEFTEGTLRVRVVYQVCNSLDDAD